MITAAPADDGGSKGRWFTTTHWSVVWHAKKTGSAGAAEALNRLFEIYRPCIIAFIRREGCRPADAEDLAQDFFSHLLAKDFLEHLQHQDGKFRAFLCKFLKNFLSDKRDKANAQKRGGGKTIVSLDELSEQTHNSFEPGDTFTPEQAFDRKWADALLDEALKKLRACYAEKGKLELFEQLKDFQPGEHGPVTYAELGRRFGLSEAAIKSEMLRMRRRHRDILLQEIAQTVLREEDLADEVKYLMELVGRPMR
jgi:RNA polymerase sigma factor (sigma-70 family)